MPPARAAGILTDVSHLNVYALPAADDLGERIAAVLKLPLSTIEVTRFEDGEEKLRATEPVAGTHAFIVSSLYGEPNSSVHDKLMRLLFFAASLRDAGARQIVAVLPYLCYSRKDRRSKPHDPLTHRYLAQLLEAAGVSGVITLDVHNLAAFENAFRCRTFHLEAQGLLVEHIVSLPSAAPWAVLSPDPGGIKRAESLRRLLAVRLNAPVPAAFVDKSRHGQQIQSDGLVGDVVGRQVLIVDDMIGTGATMVNAARLCAQAGAVRVIAAATHGLFFTGAQDLLCAPEIHTMVITNTVPPLRVRSQDRQRLDVVDVAPLIAQAMLAIDQAGAT